MSTSAGIIRASGKGPARWFYGGGLHTWKATADETGGALFAFEDSLDRGKVTPLHRHPDEDETLYVLAGEIVVVVGLSSLWVYVVAAHTVLDVHGLDVAAARQRLANDGVRVALAAAAPDYVIPEGKVVRKDCDICHTVLGQQEGAVSMASISGTTFQHPVDLGDLSAVNCSDCHTGGTGP